MRFKPAGEDRGVRFIRTDLPDHPEIPANHSAVHHRPRRTALVGEGAEIHTVEHVLSAIYGVGVTNLDIEIDGSECPGADGSALPFVEMLRRAEVMEQKPPRRTFTVREPVCFEKNGSSIIAMPPRPENENGLTVSYTLSYDIPFIGTQYLDIAVTEDSYREDIAPARTFVLEQEVEMLRSSGLGKGASYDNTLVVGAEGIQNNEARFGDEFVRHKVMDLLGDLFLLGADLVGHVVANKSGHHVNVQLVEQLRRKMEEEERADAVASGDYLDIREIQRILPHRYPFLLIDRILKLDGYRRAVGLKNVSIGEPYFQGHWPGQPVMPGVLQIEALAQLAGVLLLRRYERTGKIAVILSMDKIKIRRAIVPGDQLILEVVAEKAKPRTAQVFGRASVAGETSCEATLRFMLVDAE